MQASIANFLRSKGAVAALLTLLVAGLTWTQAQSSSTDLSQDPIVGTWVLTVTPDEGPKFIQIETYGPGGTVTAIDNAEASNLETSSVGPWKKVGNNKYYEDNYQLTYNPDGSFAGTFIVHAVDELDATGNKMLPSPYTYVILDANGHVIDSGTGTSSAVRVPSPKGPREK